MASTKAVTRSEFERLECQSDADHKLLHGNGEPGIKGDLLVLKTRVDLILGLMIPIAIALIITAIGTFTK